MNISSSRALVPVTASSARSNTDAEGLCSAGKGRRRKWMLALGVVLALAALALGSIWLGFAAILPFLYVLPCLAMVAMCMRKSGTSTET